MSDPVKKWEYLSISYDYKGWGKTKEFSDLYVDGEDVGDSSEMPQSLPELLAQVGADGWELATHTYSESSGRHHMHFKRPRSAQETNDSIL